MSEPIHLTLEQGDISPLRDLLKDDRPSALIMRGLPGAGKTYIAEQIAAERPAAIHSTDSYHEEQGIYLYQPSRLGEFHKKNQQAFRESLAQGQRLVICDNPNMRRWEYEPYLTAAREHGVRIIIALVKADPKIAAQRNLHGFSEEKVGEMYRLMEL